MNKCRLKTFQAAFYSGLTKIRTRRRAADSTNSTARRAN
ncbi:transposase, partial [Neisseria gonorrhoeae]